MNISLPQLFRQLACAFVAFCSPYPVWSEPHDCRAHFRDIPIRSLIASASVWGNMRRRPGSISFESNEIFMQAKQQADHLSAPQNFCPAGCKVAPRASFYFNSLPTKVLASYRDKEHCLTLLRTTSAAPLTYRNDEIRSVEDLNDWIKELSTGDGQQGEDLYTKCDKSCSPRYQYVVHRKDDPNIYEVVASVTCGEARDKDENNYSLQSFFRWSCETTK